MKNTNSIRNISALLMLLLFALSITPRQILHDVFATHSDQFYKHSTNVEPTISKSGFTCNLLHLVAESPFTFPASDVHIGAIQYASPLPLQLPESFISKYLPGAALRGPPCYV